MKELDGILKLVGAELEAVANNGKFRSRDEIDSVYKLIDIAKDTYEIWCMEEEMDSYSEADGYSRGGSYNSYNSYGDSSYARGRGRNARRGSMGRYSREGGNYATMSGGSYRGNYGYSRDDGKEEMMEHIQRMMDNAQNDQDRQKYQRMMQELN